MLAESTPAERDESDRNAPLAEATTRFEDRVMCSLGKGGHAQPEFSSEQALCGAGVLFLLPALISQGLLKTKEVAGRIFARWSQENFFRYLIQDYDFDKMISYGIETIDMEKEVVNPQYRKLTHHLKKLRKKNSVLKQSFMLIIRSDVSIILRKMQL